MARHATWIHGNSAVIQFPGGAGLEFTDRSRMDQVEHHAWTDVTGLHRGPGETFRGNGGNANWFHFSIPTPVIVPTPRAPGGDRTRLETVFVLFQSDPFVELQEIAAFDGPNALSVAMNRPSGASGRHDGTNGLSDLVSGITAFPIDDKPEIFWGLGISVKVGFGQTGNITFTAAGADFFTQD
jgi:hypothetical protein